MSSRTKQEYNDKISIEEGFIENLSRLDRGDLAILKRNAGNTIAESRGVSQIFYSIIPYSIANSRREEIYFLVATLYGHNKYTISGDFGTTLKNVKKDSGSSSLDHRVAVLLDSDFDVVDEYRPGGGELPYRLRQFVKLANSHEAGVNWLKLLQDLQAWNYPEKRVQKRWARSYFGQVKDEKKEQPIKEGN